MRLEKVRTNTRARCGRVPRRRTVPPQRPGICRGDRDQPVGLAAARAHPVQRRDGRVPAVQRPPVSARSIERRHEPGNPSQRARHEDRARRRDSLRAGRSGVRSGVNSPQPGSSGKLQASSTAAATLGGQRGIWSSRGQLCGYI